MRSAIAVLLGFLVASSGCGGPGAPSSPSTITLSGTDIVYQRAPTETISDIPLIAGKRADSNKPGIANTELQSVGNGQFILARPITLEFNTDYWLAVRDPDYPTVCCWSSGNIAADVVVLGQRLTRSGMVSMSTNNNFATAVQFVRIGFRKSVE